MKLGSTMLAYLPVNLAQIVVSFGGLTILTRLLTAEEYGRYALAVVTMMGLHMMLFTWLEAGIARFEARAEREGRTADHLRTVYSFAALTAAVCGTILLVGLAHLPIPERLCTVLMVAVGTSLFQLICNLGFEAHKAAHRIRRYSTVYTTHQMLSFAVGVFLVILTPLRELAPFIGIGVAIAVTLAIDLPFMSRHMRGGRVETDRIKMYFAYGFPISLSLILGYALTSGDLYIITALMGEASAGEYSASYNLALRSIDVIFIWLGMAVTPMAVTAFERSVEDSREIMRDYGAALLWVTLPAATGIALVADPAGFILGESVREGAVRILPLIAFAGVLNGLINYYAQRAFMLSGDTKAFALALVPPVILNIALNVWLIPIHGLMGAVYATVISYALGLAIALIIGRRYYPLPIPGRALVSVVGACAAMAIVVSSLPDMRGLPDIVEILLKAGVGASVYLGVTLTLNIAGCRDLLRSVTQRLGVESAVA